jgi:hypothetical protein
MSLISNVKDALPASPNQARTNYLIKRYRRYRMETIHDMCNERKLTLSTQDFS